MKKGGEGWEAKFMHDNKKNKENNKMNKNELFWNYEPKKETTIDFYKTIFARLGIKMQFF